MEARGPTKPDVADELEKIAGVVASVERSLWGKDVGPFVKQQLVNARRRLLDLARGLRGAQDGGKETTRGAG